jgi:putative sigma-54 modulation protein
MYEPIEFVIDGASIDGADALRAYATQRLSPVLRRFGHWFKHVTMRLIDVNGPRGGVDSRCSISAEIVTGNHLFVEATTAWPFASMARATSRLEAAVRHEVGRRQHPRHVPSMKRT